MKDGPYITKPWWQTKETCWVSLFIDRSMAVYFGSFGIEYILQEVLSKIKDKTFITHNIFTIQDNDSVVCGFYCIAFIEYMLTGETLLDYKKNEKIIYKYFKDKYDKPWL